MTYQEREVDVEENIIEALKASLATRSETEDNDDSGGARIATEVIGRVMKKVFPSEHIEESLKRLRSSEKSESLLSDLQDIIQAMLGVTKVSVLKIDGYHANYVGPSDNPHGIQLFRPLNGSACMSAQFLITGSFEFESKGDHAFKNTITNIEELEKFFQLSTMH